MRLPPHAISLFALLAASPALAQTAAPASPPAAAPAASAPPAPADPVVATVDNIKIHMSDIEAAAQAAPPQLQQMQPAQLFPVLVNQEVDRAALLEAAQKEDLEKNPAVAAQMKQAADIKLENAYVQQQIGPAISPTAIQAYYNQNYANKPGPEQVDARHILVPTEAQAKEIITQLNHGANFAKLATKYSTDSTNKNGGELGWFSQDEMVKPFADAAFALKPGTYTKTPVQTQFGWHVIYSEGRRTGPAPALADVQQQIREKLGNAAIQQTLDQVRGQVKIQLFNPDGSPVAPDSGAPAPAGAAAPTK
jgi:peptidyl-prolyl cis-trans isomerase C